MKNYKDKTITRLCMMLNYLDDNGCLTDEDKAEYAKIVADYYDKYEDEVLSEKSKNDNPATYHKNCYILKSREDGEVIVKTYDEEHENSMMVDVSKHICFSDCDDTYELVKVVYRGREVEYVGWRPLMEFKFKYVDTGDIAWKNSFMSWDH